MRERIRHHSERVKKKQCIVQVRVGRREREEERERGLERERERGRRERNLLTHATLHHTQTHLQLNFFDDNRAIKCLSLLSDALGDVMLCDVM